MLLEIAEGYLILAMDSGFVIFLALLDFIIVVGDDAINGFVNGLNICLIIVGVFLLILLQQGFENGLEEILVKAIIFLHSSK